jgi:hypothetical protein
MTLLIENLIYKKLTADNWLEFRSIRLDFLKNEPQAAVVTYSITSNLSQQDFENDLSNPDHVYWSAIYENHIVSIAGAKKENNQWVLKSINRLFRCSRYD